MAEITGVYRQSIGAMRFIGKRYTNADRGPSGMFDNRWGEWFENGWFDLLEKQAAMPLKDIYEDGDAMIGLMREQNGDFETFEYWIGYFLPAGTAVPEGFQYVDFPACDLGVCWVYGKEHEIFGLEGMCGERLAEKGFEAVTDWCFERYQCPRFTTPDDKGNVIIDICFFVKD